MNIDLAMKLGGIVPNPDENVVTGESYETGKLRCGNAIQHRRNSISSPIIVLRKTGRRSASPWQLLNFLNPSEMMIHDDYYECYGIENLHIDEMYAGAVKEGEEGETVRMSPFKLDGWGKKVTYHERLKKSYYILREYWSSLD